MNESDPHDAAARSGPGDPILFEVIGPADRYGPDFMTVIGGVFASGGVWQLLAGLTPQDPGIDVEMDPLNKRQVIIRETTWWNDLVWGAILLLLGCLVIYCGVQLRRYMPQRISVAPDGLIRFHMIAGNKELHLSNLLSVKAEDNEGISITLSFTNDEVVLSHFGRLDIDAFVSVIKRVSPWTRIDLSVLNR